MSWEGMGSFKFRTAEISRLLSALNNVQIRILVYLREQAEIIQSGNLQRIKQGHKNFLEIKSIENSKSIVERIRSFIFLRNPNRNYYRLLRRWEKSSLGTTFSVRIFSKLRLKDGDVVTDFLDQLDLSRDRYFVPAKDNYNQSLDVESAMLIESFHGIPSPGEDMDVLIDVAQSVISSRGRCTKYFLGEKSVRTIRKHFKRSNLKVARHYMGIESDPFVFSDCWRSESLSSIENRGPELLNKIEEISQVPTLMGVASDGNIASSVDFCDGWSESEKSRVWSLGAESKIRFRVFSRRLLKDVSLLRVVMEGRYYGNNKETNVTINGIDFGSQELRHGNCQLVIPVDSLLPNELIEITLQHRHPTRPSDFEGKKDSRPIAYSVEKIGYIPIKNCDQR